MARALNQVIAELPPDRRARIDKRHREMKNDVEGLCELPQVADKARAATRRAPITTGKRAAKSR